MFRKSWGTGERDTIIKSRYIMKVCKLCYCVNSIYDVFIKQKVANNKYTTPFWGLLFLYLINVCFSFSLKMVFCS